MLHAPRVLKIPLLRAPIRTESGMNTHDEWNDEPPPPTPPGIARAAGIAWMALGAFILLCGLAYFVFSIAVADGGDDPVPDLGWIAMGIGFGLIMCGRGIVFGKAKDVVSVSVVSIILGVIHLAVGLVVATQKVDAVVGMIIGGVCTAIALACILPAILALAGRAQYLAWRRANPPDDEEEND